MKKFIFIVGIFIGLYSVAVAQPTVLTPNLVPNPSFEYLTDCPTHKRQITKAYPWFDGYALKSPNSWEVANIFNTCFVAKPDNPFKPVHHPSAPQNGYGNQLPHTGNGYAGIEIITKRTDFGVDKNYLEVPLIDTLQAGKSYCISFYISQAEQAGSRTKVMQAYFSKDSFLVNNHLLWYGTSYYPAVSDVQFNYKNRIWLDNTKEWMQISGSFVAKGGERFMTIGNFERIDTASFSYNINNTGGYAGTFYYIDDVSVRRCSRDIIIATAPVRTINIPTLQRTNTPFNIQHLPSNTSVWLYNALGQLVYFSPNYNKNFVLESCKGIYFYKVITDDKQQYTGKFGVE